MIDHKIVHIADIHFRGYKRHKEYRKVMESFYQICRDENPDCFVLAGDIVHSKTQNITPELIEILSWWFTEMAKIAPVYITLGNHDGLLTNLTRQDTISPIVSALNNDRIFLFKDSGVYDIINNEAQLVVFSPFDEHTWPKVKEEFLQKKDDSKYSIATFHGAVNGSVSDTNWALHGDVDVSYFSDYDYTMLGDIHKRQDLDSSGRVSYPGSMIQQNFGETRSKGFLLWNIKGPDHFEKKYIELPSVHPYCTLDWKGTITETVADVDPRDLLSARVRIRSDSPLSQVETKSVSKFLRSNFSVQEVYYKSDHKNLKAIEDTSLVKNISRDPSSLAKLLSDLGYYDYNDTELKENIREILQKAKDEGAIVDLVHGKNWSVSNLKFDNTFGYGESNQIDFDNLNGLVGLFGRNRAGKSSIPATLLYGLFNTSERGLNKNQDIINVRKDYCRATVDFVVGSKNYQLDRQSIKHVTKAGEVSASTHLNLIETNENGEEVRDLNGEQRRDTDKEVQALLGTADDFILTAFATQGDQNNFINSGPTNRKEILARFLQIDFFSDLYQHFRDDSYGIRKSMKDMQDKLSEVNPKELASELKSLTNRRKNLVIEIEEIREQISNIQRNTNPDEINKNKDYRKLQLLLSDLENLQGDYEDAIAFCKKIEEKLDDSQVSISKLERKLESVDLQDLKDRKESYDDQVSLLSNAKHTFEITKNQFNSLNKSIKLLSEVPCGDQFPTCKFIKDSHESKKKIGEVKASLDSQQETIQNIECSIEKIGIDQIKKGIDKYNNLNKQISKLKIEEAEFNSSFKISKHRVRNLKEKIEDVSSEIEVLKLKWDYENTQEDVESQQNKLRNLLEKKNAEQNSVSEKIGSLTQKIKNFKEMADSVRDSKKTYQAYEVLLNAFSKNGIPAQLVNSSLPVINSKIKEVLYEDCGFTIELESDSNSKKLYVYIDYGDSKRKIECASGMEKMIANLAIRTALHSITQLPKPDFMVIDEGFGALDDTNIEVCMHMLRSLLEHFRFIMIISHIDSVKDSVDNMIEIQRHGLDSKVIYG